MSRFPIATSVLADAIGQRVFPGAAFGVLQRGEQLATESVGCFTYQLGSPRTQPDTIFDMASVSKAMATTSMAMLLWERGQLDLEEPVGQRLPEFLRGDAVAEVPAALKQKITARMLLAHCSGLPAYAPLYKSCRTASELFDACLCMPLESAPGSRAVYSDIGFILLGRLLETIAGEQLDSYCRREVFAPLGMNSTLYCPPVERRPSIPPTVDADHFRQRVLQGEVHDGNCWRLGGISGHAGVFSNVADILRLADCLLHGGGRLFRPETVSLLTERQKTPAASSWALGWDTPTSPSSSGRFFSAHSVGHLGYTGTSLWMDFDKDLSVVLLTNRTYPGNAHGPLSGEIKNVRPRFHDAVMRELGWDASSDLPLRRGV
ncbi:MAG: serine hydrolase domain-containing protein [Acidobacteriaceae bacterium]